jgi:PAS domain S-box-containing protein
MASPVAPRSIPWHLIMIFLLLLLGILSTGYFYYDYEQAYFKKQKLDEIAAIADLKIKQIINWRSERFADATLIMQDPFFAAQVKDWLKGSAKPGLRDEILHQLKAFLVYQYQNIVLLDPQGRVLLSAVGEEPELSPRTKTMALEAMQTRKVIFSNLYRRASSHVARLSILAPILLPQGTATVPVGAILMRIDPYQFLYPLIQSWPTPSRTGETLLLSREGDEVVVLNELRNRQGTAFNLRYPIQKSKLTAAMATGGQEGAVEGVDYRGVPVVGAVGHIPGSPWYFEAKIDAAEIYAPLRRQFRLELLLLIFFITGAGVSLALVWSNQQRRFFSRQYEMERARERALQKLNRELEQHAAVVQDLYNNAPCGYHSLDPDGTFVQINDTELAWLGYTQDELVGKMKFSDLLTAEGLEVFEQSFFRFKEKGQVRDLEFQMRRRDGTAMPVLLSATAVKDETGKYLMSRSTVYDLTARKQAEGALEVERQRLVDVLERIPAYVALISPNCTIPYVNREFIMRFGDPQDRLCHEFLFGRDRPCEDCKALEVLKTNTPAIWEWAGPDGNTYQRCDYPFADVDGSPLVLEMGLDISAHKQTEKAVKQSEALLRTILETLPVGVWVCDQNGRIAIGNPAAQKIWAGARYVGLDQYGLYKGWWADTGKRIKSDQWALARAFRRGETSLNEVVEIESFDGARKFILNSAVPIRGANQEITAAIMVNQDITELKAVEEKFKRINRLYSVLSKVNEAIVRLRDLRHLFQEACTILVNEGGFRMAWIGLKDPTSLLVKPVAYEGTEEGYLAGIAVSSQDTPQGAGPTGIALREGRHDICSDFALDPRMAPWREEALKRGYRSSMALPLRQDSNTVGTLTIYADKPDFFKDEEIELLEFMAGDLSFAMESMDLDKKRRRAAASLARSEQKLRRLTSQLMSAQEQERSRVSRELHDELGQSLLVLKMQMRAVQRKLGKGEQECKGEIGASLSFLDQVIENVRRLSRNLSPLILEGLGLNEALQNLIDEFAKHYGINDVLVNLDKVEGLFSQERQVNIYRIFQEALTNIAKYAQAASVAVDMKKKAKAVSFRIEDDGVGFDPEEVMSRTAQEKGLGLATMSERVMMLGGTFQIQSQKGQGTRIIFSLPAD